MSCISPIAAWQLAERSATGKRLIVFKPRGTVLSTLNLPCGKCINCRLEFSRGWAVRCLHESKMHSANMFLTLTYDRDSIPKNGSLEPKELQLFMKRLYIYFYRKFGVKIRYYAAGEYGDVNKRPHYHVLVFGVRMPDLKFYSESENGILYTSVMLDKIWGKGGCKIGEVNYKTCAYVARYVVKKVDGRKRDEGHYLVYDMDGVVTERHPEFSRMSRRPGIGFPYYAKYGHELRTHDNLIIDGRPAPSIRYYDLITERIDLKRYNAIKLARGPSTVAEARDRKSEELRLRRISDHLAKAALKLKRRKL